MQANVPPRGQRVFTCGHSFHWFVSDLVAEMALAAGIRDHVVVGLSAIGGSQVIEHWDVPSESNQAKAALREGKVDVLTLSPIWLPDAGIEKFARFAFEHNPDVRVTVQAYWLPNDEYEPQYPLNTSKVVDHEAATIDHLRQHHRRYFQDMDDAVRAVNHQLGKDVVKMVPAGQAVLELRERVINGDAPGVATQSELFTDSWGHPAAPIQVLAAYCHFAAVYGRSPEGLTVPRMLREANQPGWVDERLNRLLQQLSWSAVTQHPLSGVS